MFSPKVLLVFSEYFLLLNSIKKKTKPKKTKKKRYVTLLGTEGHISWLSIWLSNSVEKWAKQQSHFCHFCECLAKILAWNAFTSHFFTATFLPSAKHSPLSSLRFVPQKKWIAVSGLAYIETFRKNIPNYWHGHPGIWIWANFKSLLIKSHSNLLWILLFGSDFCWFSWLLKYIKQKHSTANFRLYLWFN